MDDNRILKAKAEFDDHLRMIPRTDRAWRLKLWRDWLRLWDAPLRAIQQPIIPEIADDYDPMLDCVRQWKGGR